MKNKQLLLEKREMYSGYLKVINLKRIKLQHEINNYKRQIAFVKGTIIAMKKIKETLTKESSFLSFFEYEKEPTRNWLQNIYIFLQTSDNTNIGKYSDKKIVEFITKNARPQLDVVFIIGKRLFDYAKEHCQEIHIKLLGKFKASLDKDFVKNFSIIFDKVSEISFTLYADNLVNKVVLLYSDIQEPSRLFEFLILPFNLKDVDKAVSTTFSNDLIAISNRESIGANRIFNDFDPEKAKATTFISQITSINESFLKLFLSSLSKYVVFNYLLNMAFRKMINYDEEEKNLEERLNRNRIDLQVARNEAITNEMILIASARKVITRRQFTPTIIKKEEEL